MMGLEGLMSAGYIQQLKKRVEELEKRVSRIEEKEKLSGK